MFRHLTVRDAIDLESLAATDYPLKLSSPVTGRLSFESRAMRTGPLSVFDLRSESGFHAMGCGENDGFSFSLTQAGTSVRSFGRQEARSRPGTLSISRSSELDSLDVSPRFHTTGVRIDCEFLAQQARRFADDENIGLLAFRPVVDRTEHAVAPLVHSLECLHARMMTQSGASILADPLMQELLAHQILQLWPRTRSFTDRHVLGSRVLGRARDHIEAHLAEPFTVADVAMAAGTSVRTLQSAFRREMGVSPVAYILNQRLERARALLEQRNDEEPVSQIAYRCGFLHMSDFARRYRKRFGCTPSQTRRLR